MCALGIEGEECGTDGPGVETHAVGSRQ
jgi:hypothetical protein